MTAELADQAARERIRTDLGATLFVEAGAGSGKTTSLVDRVVALVTDGVPMRSIAAITFTERAAAELRDRIRRALERLDAHEALAQLDSAAISTLHGFAQRILTEHPIEAQLPPNVQVLDEVASEIEFTDRWRRFRGRLLDTPELERCLLLAFAAGVTLTDLRNIAIAFSDNWDLVADPGRFPGNAGDLPTVDRDGFVARIEAVVARRDTCADDGDSLVAYLTDEVEPYLEQLRAAPDEYEVLRLLKAGRPSFKAGNKGRGKAWGAAKDEVIADLRAIGEERLVHADEVGQACLQRIALELARFTVDAARERRTSGRLEFHDLLVLAREVLRGEHGVQVRARLRDRYRRLLLDEFQDTDPIQIDLAVLIASSDPDAARKEWHDIEVEPGRLFFVGDPKQSIYRFRRADIELFLAASDRFGNPAVPLTTNFRTSPAVIDWVNAVFGRLIAEEPGAQPAYQGLDPAPSRGDPPAGRPVVLLGADAHEPGLSADDVREREATDVARAVQAASGWQVARPDGDGGERWEPATLGDITILLPARTSLPMLEQALDRHGIPYRAETSSLVYTTREVRDLLGVARALVDTTDQLSLVAALRSAAFGCGDDDLFTYRKLHRGAWHIHVDPPADLDPGHPVVAAMRYLEGLHGELAWLTPAELLDRIARDRRLFELGHAHGHPRDLWRRLRFVIDQARAWSEVEGGTLREYLDWAHLQASESARVSETVLPETDDDSVRIMTIHGAKGLEFPITIVSGMSTAWRGQTNRVQVAFPPGQPVGIKVGKDVVTPEFEQFKPIDEQMGFHERLRLLYVACTRARDHLVVSLHRSDRPVPDDLPKCTNAELLATALPPWGVSTEPEYGRSVDTPKVGASVSVPEPLLALAAWEAELAAVLANGSRRQTVGASSVELLATGLDEDTEAGAAKQPRDLELPPWQKGRYGTAVGRAVHAVLQTIDLATGEGLAGAAAAQAAAEGVVGREDVVARLAGLALEATAVRDAVSRQRWRETYVATPVGERTLEGYIDLLYRGDDGLVVVDYKTASTAAGLDQRVGAYRAQGGAYAVAVEGATGERVSRVVFVFLTPDGVVELDLPDLDAAKRDVRAALDGGVSI